MKTLQKFLVEDWADETDSNFSRVNAGRLLQDAVRSYDKFLDAMYAAATCGRRII